jgi:serine/threonine-protein kinase
VDYHQRFPELDLASLGELATTEGVMATSSPFATSRNMAVPVAAVDPHLRYLPLRFHARGGLGEVFVARDEQLQREVALKRIKSEHADHPDSRQRFLREAEVTSRLEHPGVVPVHGLAHDPEGRPCYAMRFVQGETLQEAIYRFHDADKPGRDPGERGLTLRQLLSRFIAVCNTIAYAHSRGILHRDLKPANIMLGKYGETLVVDWGLAKPFTRTEVERTTGEETLCPTPEEAGGGTRIGQAVGTPAYMSPEQAAGQPLSPASDIFGLGATLYTLLTGQPPYKGDRVMDKARLGKLIPPQRIKKEVPRALEAVCLKAMAVDPQERYATALELAADVEHWLADEPVTAHREPRVVKTGRWLRRHRPLVAGVVALLLAAVPLSIVIAINREQSDTRKPTSSTTRSFRVR